jgi:PAS domain S-box-containing protein
MERDAQLLLDATPVGHLLVDREIKCAFANRALLAQWGHSEAEVCGRPFAEVFPSLAPQLARILREVAGTGESFLNLTIH